MLAYHNDPELKKSVVAQMVAHRKADELVKGRYWEGGKGCAVGCLIKGSDHMLYESKFGIPVTLARLEDIIFEGLQNGAAQKWPERFLGAIKPGADLSLVQWKFLHWLQKESLKNARKKKMPDDVISAIKQCVDVLAPMAKGEPVNLEAARSAAAAAWSVESAPWSAAWSVKSAARSAAAATAAADSAESAESESAATAAEWSAPWSAAAAAAAEWSASAEWSEQEKWLKMADKLIEIIKAQGATQ